MPRVGLGTWPLSGETLESILTTALGSGYRLIDTASYYENETEIGLTLQRSEVRRDELFVTTKVRGSDHGSGAGEAVLQSLERLGTDYLDLVLIHWPMPQTNRYLETWSQLIQLQEQGVTRSIGVSNFNPHHVERLVQQTGVAPAVNQVQCSPAVQNTQMRSANTAFGSVSQAWEPLGGRSAVLDLEVIRDAAMALGRTPAQIVLRWHLQVGNTVVVKASSQVRLEQNLDLFDWSIPGDILTRINRVKQDDVNRVDPDDVHIL